MVPAEARRGLPVGCTSPLPQPPTGTGPCVGNTRRGRLDSATRGTGCEGRREGRQHGRGLAQSGVVSASWDRSQGLGLLPHRRSLQAWRGPGGGRGGRCVWSQGAFHSADTPAAGSATGPVSTWMKHTTLPRGKRCRHGPSGVRLPLRTSRQHLVWPVSSWSEEGGVQDGATAD